MSVQLPEVREVRIKQTLIMVRIGPYSIDYADCVQSLADNALGAGYFDVARMTPELGLVAKSGSDVVGFVLFEPDA